MTTHNEEREAMGGEMPEDWEPHFLPTGQDGPPEVPHIREETRSLETDLEKLLNFHSAEGVSDTPDFVLAQFLMGCLNAWNASVRRRERWYGRTIGEPLTPTGRELDDPVGSDQVGPNPPEYDEDGIIKDQATQMEPK